MNLPKVITHKNAEPYIDHLQADPYFRVGEKSLAVADAEKPGPWASQTVTLEFPMGELAGSGLKTMALLNGRVRPMDAWVENITGKEGFAAQGLEGKVCVPMPLHVALVRLDLLPEHRGRIITR